jgi:hypothetical protein
VSGADWLAVALLAGAVIIDVAFDRLRARRRRRIDAPCECWWCSQTRQHRRDRELGRLP